MKQEVKAPSVGESITEVSILKWVKQNGQAVKNGEIILEIESDKATVEVVAEANGVLQIVKEAGERVPVGQVIGYVDTDAKATVESAAVTSAKPAATPSAPVPMQASSAVSSSAQTLSPAVKKMVVENSVDPSKVQGSGKAGRLTKGDVMSYMDGTQTVKSIPVTVASDGVGVRRVRMSMLRSKIAERLKFAQDSAAILTTFNECDMSAVNKVRTQYKDKFKAKYGVPLSFMSFFARACIEAIKEIPEINASIEGNDVLYHDYMDLGIAVGTERGLVVPVIRACETKGFLQLEKDLGALAVKARDGKLSMADLSGGTFTISNGGTYGSLMSTPILNPPQSAILGMHKIMDRPIAVNGKVEIRPMMYLALSYDHRIIDGKGAVTFLVRVKDLIENPEKLNLEFAKEL
jgi:2-oxoglutarate dehydrogenase E2 component (dihydrolipoamide succinyltransferase)